MMEAFSLWATPVVRINLKDQFDMKAYADEIFAMYSMTGGEDSIQARITADLFPITFTMRDEVITPAVKEYARDHFDYCMDEFYVDTNGKWIPDGEGLYPHYHPGSVFSAICYPVDSNNAMTMFDPRGNARRGYPKKVRNGPHFGNFNISPREGDVFIFPSYVQHSVSHVTEDMRLSLLHEYHVIKDI